jgi:hypothetical protein
MTAQRPTFTLALALTAALLACRNDPPPAGAPSTVPAAPHGVARWRVDAPSERLREGALLADPPDAANSLIPSVPTALRRVVEACRADAPAHGEARVEVRFDVTREGRVTHAVGSIGGPFAVCLAARLAAEAPEIQPRPALVHVVARLIVQAPGQ